MLKTDHPQPWEAPTGGLPGTAPDWHSGSRWGAGHIHPLQTLNAWASRRADACFTVPRSGLGTGPSGGRAHRDALGPARVCEDGIGDEAHTPALQERTFQSAREATVCHTPPLLPRESVSRAYENRSSRRK